MILSSEINPQNFNNVTLVYLLVTVHCIQFRSQQILENGKNLSFLTLFGSKFKKLENSIFGQSSHSQQHTIITF